MSAEELRAFVQVAAPGYEAPRGIYTTLLWPHPETRGSRRTLEIVLTVACLPMVLAGMGMTRLARLTTRRTLTQTPGEGGAVMLAILSGGIGLFFSLLGQGALTALGVIAVESALLCTRAYIRVTSSRAHKLLEVAKPDPRPRPSARSLPVRSASGRIAAQPAPPPPSGDPTLLK
jgi:hypothetical protein